MSEATGSVQVKDRPKVANTKAPPNGKPRHDRGTAKVRPIKRGTPGDSTTPPKPERKPIDLSLIHI